MLKWLCANDFLNNRERKTTHTLMTGGVVGVPDDHYDEFLALYAAEVKQRNKTLSFSELRSDPVFCMYFDVDLLGAGVTGADEATRIFSTVQTVVRSYYAGTPSDERFRCVVCDTSPKEVIRELNGCTTTLTKTGYHMNFPDLRVTLSQALQIRYSVVYELERTMGPRPEGLNAWSDVIDKAPYTNGLKMCGSFKCVKCTDCKKSDPGFMEKKKALLSKLAKLRKKIFPRESGFDYADLADIHADEFKDAVFGDMYGQYLELTGFNSCRVCLNTGKVVEDRTYMPRIVLDGAGDSDASLLDVFREDFYKVMKYTSIRCQEGDSESTGFAIPKGVPLAPTEDNGANMRSFSSKKLTHLGSDMRAIAVNNDMYLMDAQTMYLWEGPRVLDELRLSTIEKFIRGSICNTYAEVQIRKVCESQLKKKTPVRANSGEKMMTSLVGAHASATPPPPSFTITNRYLVNVAGRGSTYCMNKGAEHTSNSVYFIIEYDLCFQRCFSKKDDIRAGGVKCSDYKSSGTRVPAWVSSVLFPDEARKRVSSLGASRPAASSSKNKRKKKRSSKQTDWGMKKL